MSMHRERDIHLGVLMAILERRGGAAFFTTNLMTVHFEERRRTDEAQGDGNVWEGFCQVGLVQMKKRLPRLIFCSKRAC